MSEQSGEFSLPESTEKLTLSPETVLPTAEAETTPVTPEAEKSSAAEQQTPEHRVSSRKWWDIFRPRSGQPRPETTVIQPIESSEPNKISRREFFGAFKPKNPEHEQTRVIEDQQEPSPLKIKATRREVLKGISAVTAIAGATELLRRTQAIRQLGIIGERLFLKTIKSISAERDVNLQTFFSEASKFVDHEGPQRFVIPEQFAGKDWNESELSFVNDIISKSRELMESTYGEPAGWTQNESTIVTDDVLGYFAQKEYAQAAFLDCDLLTEDLFQRNRLLDRVNLMLLPKPFIQELIEERQNDETMFSFTAPSVTHEFDHAYNQYQFPIIIREGLAEMSKHMMHKILDPEMADHMEGKYREDVESLNNPESLQGMGFDEIIQANPFRGEGLYNAAGQLMYEWQSKHPDFFRELRRRENSFYSETRRIPTFDEWKNIGETVEAGFQSWIEGQPVLNIPD
ncbi:hypothetical protein HY469_02020 [Candidatus Roizmanbacteria bacterium]|nr:hypothetical protein [Candidatus Roizmanbacteria bacterium]